MENLVLKLSEVDDELESNVIIYSFSYLYLYILLSIIDLAAERIALKQKHIEFFRLPDNVKLVGSLAKVQKEVGNQSDIVSTDLKTLKEMAD
jgi:hypothetical protein